MDVSNINIGGLVGGAPKAPMPKRADLPAPKLDLPAVKPKAAEVPLPQIQAQPEVNIEDNVQKIRKVSETARNFFAVSDQRFTIFKNAQGQYVTRYTSLRDGSVTYFPEQDLYNMVSSRNSSFEA